MSSPHPASANILDALSEVTAAMIAARSFSALLEVVHRQIMAAVGADVTLVATPTEEFWLCDVRERETIYTVNLKRWQLSIYRLTALHKDYRYGVFRARKQQHRP
jgi:hypothetical protein